MSIDLNQLDPEIRKKLQQLQQMQQNFEFLQNQKLQLESKQREAELAIEELNKLDPEEIVYKSIGGLMIKSKRDKLLDEKKNENTTLEMRLKTVNQKVERVKNQLETLRNNIQQSIQNQAA
jgi:prefoldin beta subunit